MKMVEKKSINDQVKKKNQTKAQFSQHFNTIGAYHPRKNRYSYACVNGFTANQLSLPHKQPQTKKNPQY
jgi:hypothetical protein